MLAEQRQREILSRLADNGSVSVGELARVFPVSEETIRRDLSKLQDQRLLRRTHGGAVAIDGDAEELPFDVRQTTRQVAKRAIAAEALRHIEPADVIALDASSTSHQLACALPDMELTVITNSVTIAAELFPRRNVQVFVTGGRLDRDGYCYVGPLAEQVLQQLSFAKLFFSCKGVDLTRGLSEASDDHARIKRSMLGLAEHRYLLADASKFGVRSLVCFAEPDDVEMIITDAEAPLELTAGLAERDLEMRVASTSESASPDTGG